MTDRWAPGRQCGRAFVSDRSRLRLPVEQLLGSKEVDPAVDEVE